MRIVFILNYLFRRTVWPTQFCAEAVLSVIAVVVLMKILKRLPERDGQSSLPLLLSV